MARKPQWLVIAEREFIERVRTVWFAVVTVLGPLMMIAVVVIPAWLTARSITEDEVRISVVDKSGEGLGTALANEPDWLKLGFNIKATVAEPGSTVESLLPEVEKNRIDGFLILPEDILEGGTAVYRGDNAASLAIKEGIRRLVEGLVRRALARKRNIDSRDLEALLAPVSFKAEHTTGAAPTSSAEASFFVGYAVMFILYMSILLYAVNVLRGVIQEKTSKVVELIVSTTKPRSLMLGKILGVGSVGLFQLLLWAVMAVLIVRYREQVVGLFGIPGAGLVKVPSLGLVDLMVVLTYFLGGYFFYAAIYAGIGAMVSSEQEAQQAQTPVVLLLIIPVACVQLVAGDPRGGIAQLLTMIPISSPVLMPMRYTLGGASPAEVALSLVILAASTALVVWVAARIYRVGILMTGKRPSLRELWRWIRHD